MNFLDQCFQNLQHCIQTHTESQRDRLSDATENIITLNSQGVGKGGEWEGNKFKNTQWRANRKSNRPAFNDFAETTHAVLLLYAVVVNQLTELIAAAKLLLLKKLCCGDRGLCGRLFD